jgi:hypothetical protein
MNTKTDLLTEALRHKQAYRREAMAMTWPQKVAAIERMREASVLAKAGMRATRATVTLDNRVLRHTAA